ncbi:MAG: hypothetical protein KBB55_00980 [Candidatus Buchananbacteria bacterium]|nr:hypothetical protein [Candidatus Buchananbacteria bacterium]
MRNCLAFIGHLIEDLSLFGRDLVLYSRLFWLWAWDKNVKLRWYRCCWWFGWIPKDEFHSALSIDPGLLMVMNPEESKRYHEEIAFQRQRAHVADLKRRYRGLGR